MAFLIELIIINNKIKICNINTSSSKFLEEYNLLKSLETFDIKYTSFNKEKIVHISPLSKKFIEEYANNSEITWENKDNYFVNEEENKQFLNSTKLGALATYLRINPEIREDIRTILMQLPEEKDRDKKLNLINTVLDKFAEMKEEYKKCTLLGIKKSSMPDGRQIALQSFFKINEKGNLEMFCVDISDTLNNEDIQAEIKYKTIFFSKIAHEFKNPLITINETIKQNLSLFNAKELNIISSLSDYMIILIKDFDYFSKTLCESKNETNDNETKFNIEDTDIIKIVEFCHNLFKIRISILEKPLEFNVKIDSEVEKFNLVSTDDLRLKQCIINLLSNSIKFTNFGSVDLILKLKSRNYNLNKTQNYLKIIVKDTGIGMEEKQLKKIAECTLYAKNQNISNSMGSGLGLIIVKDIIQKLGKEFKIKSQLNKGTKVSFLIPLSTDYDKLSEITEKVEFNPENAFNKCKCLYIGLIENDTNESPDSLSEYSIIKNEEENLLFTDNFNKNRLEGLDTNNTFNIRNKFNPKLLKITNCRFSLGQNSEYEWETIFENLNNYPPNLLFPSNKMFKIIIVEDEQIIRQSQINLVRKYCKINNIKIQIKECKDGIECLYEIYQGINNGIKYDAIITDQFMNFFQGSYTAKIIKHLIEQRSIYPIKIFLSSSLGLYGPSDDTNEFGCFDKIYNKPLTLKNVKNIFEELE